MEHRTINAYTSKVVLHDPAEHEKFFLPLIKYNDVNTFFKIILLSTVCMTSLSSKTVLKLRFVCFEVTICNVRQIITIYDSSSIT